MIQSKPKQTLTTDPQLSNNWKMKRAGFQGFSVQKRPSFYNPSTNPNTMISLA